MTHYCANELQKLSRAVIANERLFAVRRMIERFLSDDTALTDAY